MIESNLEKKNHTLRNRKIVLKSVRKKAKFRMAKSYSKE